MNGEIDRPPKPEKKFCDVCGEEIEYRWIDSVPMMRIWHLEKPAWVEFPCWKCIEREQREKMEEEERQKRIERLNRLVDNCCLKKRFRESTFENYILEDGPNQRKAYNFCRKFADEFEEKSSRGANLVLLGGVGCGKTHLSIAIARELMKKNIDCLYVKIPMLFRKIKATFDRRGDGATQDEIVNSLIDVKLLILDDVEYSLDTAWENMILFDILGNRFDDVKSTILISNLNFDKLSALLGRPLVDRLYEDDSTIVIFDWVSYRRKMRRNKIDKL